MTDQEIIADALNARRKEQDERDSLAIDDPVHLHPLHPLGDRLYWRAKAAGRSEKAAQQLALVYHVPW